MTTLPNGWYRMTRGAAELEYNRVHNGYIDGGDGAPVAACLQWGWTFEPAVVMTRAEYDAAVAEAVAKAQEPDEAPHGYFAGTGSLAYAPDAKEPSE